MQIVFDPEFKYDFPIGISDPFDFDFKGDYFVFANAFSNLSDSLEDFSIKNLSENIPMGYKTIVLQKRTYAIANGKMVKEFNKNKEGFQGKRFFLTSARKVRLNRNEEGPEEYTHVLYKPDACDRSLQSCTWENIHDCLAYSKILSKEENTCILISEIIDSINWH